MGKRFASFCILLCLLSACSNKYESLYDSAPKPALSFSKDTVVIREKDYTNIRRTNNGKLTLYSPDQAHQLNIQFSDTSGRIHFAYRGEALQNGQPLVVMDSVAVFVSCDTAGLYTVDFFLTDLLGKVTQKQLIVNCLANQKAKARFFYVPLDSSQPQNWGYLFDASDSQKPDGIITAYHYSINGQQISTNQPVMNWNFHARGTHEISLYVADDLGKNSDTIHQKLIIQ